MKPMTDPIADAPLPSDSCCSDCTPLQEALTATQAADFAQVFKALSDPIRVRIASIVARQPTGEVRVCDIAAHFHVTGPTVSHHLRKLREAGLLVSERRANEQYYRIHSERAALVLELFAAAVGLGTEEVTPIRAVSTQD